MHTKDKCLAGYVPIFSCTYVHTYIHLPTAHADKEMTERPRDSHTYEVHRYKKTVTQHLYGQASCSDRQLEGRESESRKKSLCVTRQLAEQPTAATHPQAVHVQCKTRYGMGRARHCKAGKGREGRARQGTARHCRAGQGRAGQGRAEQSRAGQDRASKTQHEHDMRHKSRSRLDQIRSDQILLRLMVTLTKSSVETLKTMSRELVADI
jgi:hypothetical protein